jgi:branched-chain amino acid transport system substrate-binding protein
MQVSLRWFGRRFTPAGLIVVVLALTNLTAFNETRAENQVRDTREPIKIGFIASLSGVGSKGGEDEVNGIKLFLDQIGYTIAGRKVELLVENDESNPSMGVQKMLKLVKTDHVQILDGVTFSHVALALAAADEKCQVPLIIAIPGADDLTQRKRSPWVVRTSFSSSQSSMPFGEWVHKNLKYKRVATVGVNFPYSWESVGGFQKTFEASGGQIVQKIWVPLGYMDFSSYLSKLRKDCDAVYIVTIGTAAAALSQQLRQLYPKLPIISAAATFEETALRSMGDEVLGSTTAVIYSAALDTKNNKRFVEEYKTRYGYEPSQFAEGAYTSGMAIRQAVQRIGGNVEDGRQLLAALKKVVLKDAPRGALKLDDYGNPVENVYIARIERVNGHLQQTVLDTIPNVSQFGKASPDKFLQEPSFSADYPPCRYCTNSP